MSNICRFALILLTGFSSLFSNAETADSLFVADDEISRTNDNIFKKVIRYFDNSNEPKPEKNLDFSFIAGPAYSSETSLQIGIVGAALYKSRPDVPLTSQSNASLLIKASITGYYSVGLRGSHFGPSDKYRIVYDFDFSSFPGYFWGIGYDAAIQNENKTKFLQLSAALESSFEWSLARNLYLGPAVSFKYVQAKKADNWALWDDEAASIAAFGPGINLIYDSRDNINNARSGWLAAVQQRFFARFLGNDYAFGSTEVQLAGYGKVWKGGIIAGKIHGRFTYGNTPWTMLPTFGGSHSMRGYYEGRFRDKNETDLTLELRQQVWRRNSVVAWIGAGTVFRSFRELRKREILPNFGVGYRWEFKNRVNLRLDLGFGRDDFGLVFNVNEAF